MMPDMFAGLPRQFLTATLRAVAIASSVAVSTSLWVPAAMAQTGVPSIEPGAITLDDPPQMRFLAAEAALASNDAARYEQLRNSLADYPLTPYLDKAHLAKRLSGISSDEVDAFLQTHEGAPFAKSLRSDWLRVLANRGRWSQFLDTYRDTKRTDMRCLHGRALLNAGQRDAGMDAARELWLVGRSQSEICDPLFEAWIAAGQRTPERVWRRVALAAEKRNTKFMRYLERLLPPSSATLASHWRLALEKPKTAKTPLLAAVATAAPREQREEVLVHGIERIAGTDPDGAESFYKQLAGRFKFTEPAQAEIARQLGLAYAYRGRISALPWFQTYAGLDAGAGSTVETHHKTVAWHAVILLSNARWDELMTLLAAMPAELSDAARWQYWRARALSELDRADEARAIFANLATERGYYSFLSADRIDVPYAIENRPFEPSAQEAEQFSAKSSVQRAREFYRLGRLTEARREWRELTRELDDRELAVAARTAKDWGWVSNAVLTGARSSTIRDDLNVRFPVAYRQQLTSAAAAQNIDLAWAYAVTRQESAFMSEVRSGAGAIGLMQIMPATGKFIARKSKRKWGGRQSLEDPVTNTTYGSLYLNWMAERFGGRKLLATAAYNAGPGRVNRWLPKTRSMPADAWVETITFNETRNYVQRVMSYMAIYERHLGIEPSRLSQRMQPVLPR